MDLARDEETRVRNLGRLALERAAKAGASMAANSGGISRTFATVSRVNGDGTIDVSMGDYTDVNGVTSECILRGLRMTVACSSAQVGDRVIVDTYAHVSVVTGILANADNTHYVNVKAVYYRNIVIRTDGSARWLWCSENQFVDLFGVNSDKALIVVSNGDAAAAEFTAVPSFANGQVYIDTTKANAMIRIRIHIITFNGL